jgi:CRP-like cAMP-binding protein
MDEETCNDATPSLYSRLNQRRRTSVTSDIFNNPEVHGLLRKASIFGAELPPIFQKKANGFESRRASLKPSNSRFRRFSKGFSTRKLSEEHIISLRKTFVKAVRLSIICINWCKWAYKRNKEMRDKYLSFSQMFDFENTVQEDNNDFKNLTSSNSEVVSFNKDYYKSKRNVHLNLSNDIKQVLFKRDIERTKGEIEMLRQFFRHMKSINTLPVEMQTKVFKKCWLEIYEPKRVIIRQGHRAESFYFILSGTLVVTNRPDNSNISYTVCFLDAGVSFGELALLSKSLRTSNVISKTRVELLVIDKEDFYRIFGGEKSEIDLLNREKTQAESLKSVSKQSSKPLVDNRELSNVEFLKKLKFLNGWSFDTIVQNPKSVIFCYFPRGQVLVRNGNLSKYIYIVKKGSISVWVKVRRRKEKFEDPKVIRRYLSRKKSSASDFDDDDYLNEHHNGPKDDDMAINSKLGASNSYLESDNYLKEQHNEAINSTSDHKEIHQKKQQQHKPETDNQKSRNRLNYLMEYLEMTKGSNSTAVEVKDSKGVKIMPGILDKRDKLKILETHSEKEPSFHYKDDFLPDITEARSAKTRSSDKVAELEDKHTFSKGLLHLPKIRVERVNKRAELRRSIDVNNVESIGNSRRVSTYMASLPKLVEQSNKTRNSIPRNQYKTTIELMESNDANTRRESVVNSNFNDISKKHKHLSTTTPMFKSSTPNKHMLLPFDKDFFNDNKENDDEYVTEYIEVQVLESGSHFGLAEILFESQPNMLLISNSCDCILLPKELFIQNANTTYIRNLRRDEIPFPTMNEIMRSYNESSSWKKYSSELANDTNVHTKRYKRNEELKLSKSQLKFQRQNPVVFKSSLY